VRAGLYVSAEASTRPFLCITESAVNDAQANAAANNITNATFIKVGEYNEHDGDFMYPRNASHLAHAS
jgi:hypothetical protein